MNEYGARGIGEIGMAGVAPAITAAVYHATGVRVRELPVRIEDLLKSHSSRGMTAWRQDTSRRRERQRMSTTPASELSERPTPRIDGPLKTTGTAEYAADFHFERMAYAVPVVASIASGRIRTLDTSAAEKMPGVLLVLHHGNIGPLYRTVPGDDNATNSEVRSAFEDDVVRHWGQYIALVVAETFEQATAAAAAVKAEYEPEPAKLRTSLDDYSGERKKGSQRGDFDGAFEHAPVKVDQTYVTPIETHNPIEMHASVAVWDGDQLTMYETIAGRCESSRGDGADAWHSGRERARRHALSWIGIWRQALSLAALRDECGGRAQARPAGEAEPHPPHDVLERRLSSAHRAAHPARRIEGRQAARARARII